MHITLEEQGQACSKFKSLSLHMNDITKICLCVSAYMSMSVTERYHCFHITTNLSNRNMV
jgi:hypothetical protein